MRSTAQDRRERAAAAQRRYYRKTAPRWREYARRWREGHDRAEITARNLRYRDASQAATVATGVNARKQWTCRDLAAATDPGLTARQAALQLGRTLRAVENVRARSAVNAGV